MNELDHILQQMGEANATHAQAKEEFQALVTDIKTGKRTNGDLVRDFCFVHDGTADLKRALNSAERIQKIVARITEARGQPVLVHTRLRYRREREPLDEREGIGCLPRPASIFDSESDTHVLRYGVIGDLAWSPGGLDVARPYAFHVRDSPRWSLETVASLIPFGEWAPYDAALRLGTVEFFNREWDWPITWFPRPEEDAQRRDLSPAILDALNKGPLRIGKRITEQETSILIGDEIEKAIGNWYTFSNALGSSKNPETKEQCIARNLADAVCCIEHGMTRGNYEQKRARELRERQVVLFTDLIEAYLRGDGTLTARLEEAHALGIHLADITLEPRPGMRVSAREYLPHLYEKNGVRV